MVYHTYQVFPCAFFMILSSECNDVWFRLLLWCLFGSYWKTDFSQLQNQSIIYALTLHIWKHKYSGDFDFIILFLCILSLYAINFGETSLFANSSFTYLAMLNMSLYLIYYINLNEWTSFYFCYLRNHLIFIRQYLLMCVLGLDLN